MFKFLRRKLNIKDNPESGLSYIELIVLISIIGMLTGGIVINFRQAEKRKSVALAADTVTNGIRLTQSYALSGKQIPSNATRVYNSTTPGDCPAGSKAPSDYRIVFSGNTSVYTIYATDKCADIWRIEEARLPINSLVRSNGAKIDVTSGNELQLVFTPPFARMTVANSATISPPPALRTFVASEITVQHNDPALTKTVRIDAISGKIGEQ